MTPNQTKSHDRKKSKQFSINGKITKPQSQPNSKSHVSSSRAGGARRSQSNPKSAVSAATHERSVQTSQARKAGKGNDEQRLVKAINDENLSTIRNDVPRSSGSKQEHARKPKVHTSSKESINEVRTISKDADYGEQPAIVAPVIRRDDSADAVPIAQRERESRSALCILDCIDTKQKTQKRLYFDPMLSWRLSGKGSNLVVTATYCRVPTTPMQRPLLVAICP